VVYDLQQAYPNVARQRNYFLRGVNAYGSPTSGPVPASLWFRPVGNGVFRQFNTHPYRECHWDLLQWGSGAHPVLLYLETQANCYWKHTGVELSPGIAFMPKTWTAGSRWTDSGVSNAVYSEDGHAVCSGPNIWRSNVFGLRKLANGAVVIHTQTNETQALDPIAGAPPSTSCPSGQVTRFDWQENFYLRTKLVVRDDKGAAVGFDAGLSRSAGGNTATFRVTGHPDWNAVFSHWEAMPPSQAGSMAASIDRITASSTGTTITFTYTAPPSGLRDGTVSLDVPAGWTAPIIKDGAGCTTTTAGSLSTSGQTITVSALTLPAHGRLAIVYGSVSAGSCSALDGAAAPSAPGNPIWQVKVALRNGAPSTDLTASPYVRVSA
jgi:hypothetical protein